MGNTRLWRIYFLLRERNRATEGVEGLQAKAIGGEHAPDDDVHQGEQHHGDDETDVLTEVAAGGVLVRDVVVFLEVAP